ncbi:conserved uncharacterized protein, DUF490 [Desulfosarcina variabilis str. Montpellier]|uniref:translocation/assembly module TamB domain-containing protein n=1 Tax=Desulfosarcina variabilis TaxID=2300 RepID=UPI003AFA90C0
MKSKHPPMLILAAIVVAGLTIVCCGMLIWIQSSPGITWLQSRINAAIPGSVAIDGCRLSILRPRLELNGVILYDLSGTPVAGFDNLLVTLRWLPLLQREIHLEDVRLKTPWADLLLDKTSGLNLVSAVVAPGKEEPDSSPPTDLDDLPVNFVCRSFQLIGGRLSFKLPDDNMQAHADGITLSANGDLKAKQAGLDLDVSRARYQDKTIQPPGAQITLKARLNGDKLHLPTATITAGEITAKLNGYLDALTRKPVVDASLSIASPLAELKDALNIAGDYRGMANADLRLEGAIANPLARIGLTIDDGWFAGQPLDQFRLSVGLEDRLVTINDSALRLADGTINLDGTADLRTAFPSGFLEPPADMDAVTYTLNLVPDIPQLSPWLKSWMSMTGKLNGGIHLKGTGISPSAMSARLTLDAKGRHLLAPGMDRPVDTDLKVSGTMDQGKIFIDQLNADTDGLKLSGTGRMDVNERTLAGDLALNAPDLSHALAVVGVPWASGACTARIQADGSLDQPQLSLSLSTRNLGVETYRLGNLLIDLNMDQDGIIDLSTLTLENRKSRIQGSGRLRLRDNQIDPDYDNAAAVDITSFSVADFMDSPPVHGTLDGRLTVSGPLKALQGALTLKATSLTSKAATIGHVDARLRWDNGTVTMDQLDLTNHASVLTARGQLQLLVPGSMTPVQDPSFSFDASADHLNPGDFIDQANGDFTLQAALTGQINDPQGTIAINGEDIDIAGQPVSLFTLDSRLYQRKLWIDRLVAGVAPKEKITTSGWVGLDRTMAIQLKSDGISLSNIQHLKDRVPGNGKLQGVTTAEGNIQNPDIEGHLTLSEVTINDEALDDMHLSYSLHDMQAKAKGDLNAILDATCDLRQGDFHIDLDFDNTETATYFKAAGIPDIHGKLSGQVKAAGNIQDARNAKATVDVDSLHLLSRNISLVKTNQIHMHFDGGKLSIPEFEMAILSTGKLNIQGDAQLDGQLNMAVNGRLPLAAAGAFNPELSDAAGIVALDGRFSGSTDFPLFDARVDLESIAMVVPGITQKLHDLNGQIMLTDSTIRVKDVKGFLDTGSFTLDGTVNHQHFVPKDVNLAMGAKALPLEIPDTLSLLLNTDIGITGRDGIAEAKGELVVLEGLYYKDVKINLLKLATAATERQRQVTPTTEPLTIPYFDTVNLDIAIRHRQAFEVENNLAELEISPDLQVGGTLARPIVSGRAQVKEGTVTFQKKTFEVTKGVIDFVNPYKTEAEIDIVSETQIRSWTITLTIKGKPDNLDLKLSSNPSETDSDILSLVLFGKTGRELTAGEGGSKLSTGQIMAELIADTFGDDIKKSTGIDILQVEENGNSDDDEEASSVTVTVGKHLSDRMTVKYAVESKDGEIIQRAISEYKLLDNILVSGFQDSKGIYGSEFVFRIEFR